MDHTKQTTPNSENEQKQNIQSEEVSLQQYEVPIATKIGLAFIIAVLSCIAVLADSLLIDIFCTVLAAATLSFTGVLTSSGVYVFALLPALCFSVYPTLDTMALCMLIYLIACAIIMTKAVYQRKNKTQTTLYVTVTLSVAIIATVALYFLGNYGTEAGKIFTATYHAFFDEIKKGLLLVFEETKTALIAQGVYTEDYELLFSEAYATELVRSIKNIFAPSVCVIVMALSYVSVSAFSIIAKNLHTEALLPKHYRITLKIPTAVLYIICIFLSLFSPATSFLFLASQNLTILLSPSFLIVGIREYIMQIRTNKRIPFSLIFYIFTLFISPFLPIYFLIFSGISATFAQRRNRKPKL